MSGREFFNAILAGDVYEQVLDTGSKLLIVDGDEMVDEMDPANLEVVGTVPAVIACVTSSSSTRRPQWADLVVTEGSFEYNQMLALVASKPMASTSLALLLRSSERRTISEGLIAESVTYGLLQSGPEFVKWRDEQAVLPRSKETQNPVRVLREDGVLRIELNRPHVKNAIDSKMRDALVAALHVGALDPSITAVVLTGAGDDFCSGGDLTEFGTSPDTSTAHLVRMQRSVAREMLSIRDKMTVRLRGHVVGAGVEFSACADRVVASPSTTLSLPELQFGLIPGAGGTVSLTRRVGRHATMLLALGQSTIDAPEALRIGLIDAVTDEL